MGACLVRTGQSVEALEVLSEALRTLGSRLGADHPDLVQTLVFIGDANLELELLDGRSGQLVDLRREQLEAWLQRHR